MAGGTDLKDLTKKKNITHPSEGNCDCPGRLPEPFPAASGGFPFLLKHRTNDILKHKLKGSPLQSKRLDSQCLTITSGGDPPATPTSTNTSLNGSQGSPSLNFLLPPLRTLAGEDDLAAQCPEEETGTSRLRVTLGL